MPGTDVIVGAESGSAIFLRIASLRASDLEHIFMLCYCLLVKLVGYHSLLLYRAPVWPLLSIPSINELATNIGALTPEYIYASSLYWLHPKILSRLYS